MEIDRFGRPFGIYRERAIFLLCKEMRTSLVKKATSMKQLRPLKLKKVSVEAMVKRRGRVMYGLLSSEEKLDFALRARTSTAKVRLPSGMFATAAAPSQQGID